MQHRLIPLGCLILALACPAQKPTLTTDTSTVSPATGGAQQFTLDAGSQHGARFYWILGSLTGTSPGINLGSLHLPLNPDPWTDITIAWANTAWLTNTNGRLDPSGKAQAFFNVPKVTNPKAFGLTFNHAYVVYDAQSNLHMVSNPVPLRLVPAGEIKETFANSSQLDTRVSSGVWANGKAIPPQVGGTGIHGSFQPDSGTAYINPLNRKTWYVWSTDKQVIPAKLTQSGKDETVTDGVFHFTDFVLPQGVRVVFEGSNPVVINVRGKCQVDGTLNLGVAFRDVNRSIKLVLVTPDAPGGKTGASNPFGYDGEGNAGQVATKGGPGGGRGGKGGEPCLNTGSNAKYNGANGSDVQLRSGHSHSAAAKGTGGFGAPLYPAKGKLVTTGTDYDVLNTYAAYTAAGGGGGGFSAPGTSSQVFQVPPIGGTARRQPNDSIRMGPRIQGGKAFDPTAATPSGTSLDHYLIGGPGGGGGCSHPLLTSGTSRRWLGGAAGSGGGGAIAFRVGQDMRMAISGIVSAQGGSGYVYGTNTAELFNLPCAGGGGGGGSILLQVFGNVSLAGKLDTSGGRGGAIDNTKTQVASVFGVRALAGNGSPGYVRLETPGGAKVTQLGSTVPTAGPKNAGTLTDVDIKSSSQSKFYSTRLTFPPTFLRYELEVILNGTTRKLYSDDPDVGRSTSNIFDKDYSGRAHGVQPVWFRLQGVTVSMVTGQPDLKTLGPWRELVKGTTASINLDRANAFRFLLTFDQSSTKTIEVRRVSVFFTN
ncbi:MAG: hypothetical protein ACYTGW_07745 [Planctomycetota bacterium]|jgi:hypothetical protein